MNDHILPLIALMVINLMDLTMFYLLGHKLVNEEILLSCKRIDMKTIKTIVFGLIYGLIMGGFAYTVEINYVDGYIFRSISMGLMICILKFISKRSLSDTFLIFVTNFLIILFIQVPFGLLFKILSFNDMYIPLIGQVFTLIMTTFLYFKVPIHHFFGLVEQKILLKLILYLVIGMASILLLYANYNYSVYSLLYFVLLIVLTMVGLSLVLARVSFYTDQVSENLHDTKNLLIGAHMTASSTTAIDDVRKNLNECIELLQLQNSVLDHFEVDQAKENLLIFIQQKKEEKSSELDIITQIDYHDAYKKISLGTIVYMLGTLLDNAIEYVLKHQLKKKPILVDLLIMDDCVKIVVSNPYEKQVTEEFSQVFEKGYSTKLSHARGRDGRGYGLSNLKKVVRKYDGIIYYGDEYHSEYESNYLTITLDVGHFSPYKDHLLTKFTNFQDGSLILVK